MTPETTARPFRRRKNRPEETPLRQPDGFALPPRHVLAAHIEDAACQGIRRCGLDPDNGGLALVPGWTPGRVAAALLEAAGDYVAALGSNWPGFWRVDAELDVRGQPNRLLISDTWTTVVRPITWRQRHVVLAEEAIALASPNAPRRFARAVARLTASLLVPAAPGGHHVH